MPSLMDDVFLNYHVVMRYHDIIVVSYDDEFYAILLIHMICYELLIHMICYVLLNYYGVMLYHAIIFKARIKGELPHLPILLCI